MTRLACTHCGQPVLLAQNNRILTAQPTPLGIYDPIDGQPLTRGELAARVRATGNAGHGTHHCPEPQQAGLFDDPQEVAS